MYGVYISGETGFGLANLKMICPSVLAELQDYEYGLFEVVNDIFISYRL